MAYTRKTVDINISDELKEVLYKMSNMSLVARMLLRHRHPVESIVDNHIDYLSIASDRVTLSYLTQDRISKVDGDFWSSSKRYHTKPGSFVKKIFKDISDKDIEIFSGLYRNIQSSPSSSFRIVEGDEIKKWYHHSNYVDQSSSLGNSCMKHGNCQHYFSIYTENKCVRMLIMVDQTDKLIGRALLWTSGDIKVMDRIYTINDEKYTFSFKKWANENGYMYKKEQKWNNTLMFEKNGVEELSKISIVLEKSDFNRYPYLDTFKFLDVENKTLYNYIPENSNNCITISFGDGCYHDGEYLAMDGITNLLHYRNETVPIEYLNIRVYSGNAYYSEVNNCYLLIKDAKYHDDIQDYIFIDDEKNDKEAIELRLKKIEDDKKKYDEMMKSKYSKTRRTYMEAFSGWDLSSVIG